MNALNYDVYINGEKIGELQAFEDYWVRRYKGRVPGALGSAGELPDPNREKINIALAKSTQPGDWYYRVDGWKRISFP